MAMREAAGTLIADWRERGRNLGFGAGITQGYATLGQIGFSERSCYTAIGTVCNVAARLCAEVLNDSLLEEDGFEPSVPLLRKALLGVANRRRRHERRSHLQVQARDGNACLEWLPIAFPFAEGPRVRIRLPPAVSRANYDRVIAALNGVTWGSVPIVVT